MNKKKIRVAVIFGGKSAEHEVSIQSAKNILASLNPDKYETIPVGIDKNGLWHLSSAKQLLSSRNPRLLKLNREEKSVAMVIRKETGELVHTDTRESIGKIDVVFPVMHGPMGEDGTIQGMLKIMDVPFVGPGVLGSAVGMDKDVMKRLLAEAKIPITRYTTLTKSSKIQFLKIRDALGLPLFVKPANLGSSVGVSKVKNEKEFKAAIKLAFQFDNKILVERLVKGREIECSVLGNDRPIASVPGEIIPTHEFYSYDAKYIDENGARLEIPAKLPKNVIRSIRELAIQTFKALCLEGMARVDFFLTPQNRVIVNEVNTIPGFTNISMYPKLWEASGISQPELVDRLIKLAIDRYKKEKSLKTSFQ